MGFLDSYVAQLRVSSKSECIASKAVSLHLGRMVIVSDPQYSPIWCKSDSDTIRVRISCYLEGQEDDE